MELTGKTTSLAMSEETDHWQSPTFNCPTPNELMFISSTHRYCKTNQRKYKQHNTNHKGKQRYSFKNAAPAREYSWRMMWLTVGHFHRNTVEEYSFH